MMATRTVRPKEERLTEIEKKIAHHQHCIAALEEKKKAMLAPRTRKTKPGISSISKELKEKNVDPEKALEALKQAGLI